MVTNINNRQKLFRCKQFLIQNFNKKNNLLRLIFFAIAAAIVIACAWPMHVFAMNAASSHYGNGLIQIDIALNDGISFSILSGNPVAIYCLQATIILIILGCLLLCVK